MEVEIICNHGSIGKKRFTNVTDINIFERLLCLYIEDENKTFIFPTTHLSMIEIQDDEHNWNIIQLLKAQQIEKDKVI